MTLPPNVRVDFSVLLDGLKDTLSEAMIDLLQKEHKDAAGKDGFIEELASVMATALLTGNDKMIDEANANLQWIAERHRLRLAVAARETLARLLKVVSSAATTILGSLVPMAVQALTPLVAPVVAKES